MVKKALFYSLVLAISATTISPPLAKAAIVSNSKKDIVSELITLKSKKSQLGNEIASLDSRLTKIDGHLNKLDKDIIDTEFRLNKELKTLSARAKAMYKDDRHHNVLTLILQSESIYDLVTRFDFFRLIINQDLELIKNTRKDRTKLIKLKKDYLIKRQKVAILKGNKQQALTDARIVKLKLEKRLKEANRKQIALANQGLNTARFYDKYLTSKKSPMAGLGATLVAAGRQYSINPSLVVAIAGVESSFGVYNANAYNAWGRKAKGGSYEAFASWEDAVYNQTQYLRIKYYNIGLTTLVAIGSKYAPGNSSWPGKVQHFLDDIKDFK